MSGYRRLLHCISISCIYSLYLCAPLCHTEYSRENLDVATQIPFSPNSTHLAGRIEQCVLCRTISKHHFAICNLHDARIYIGGQTHAYEWMYDNRVKAAHRLPCSSHIKCNNAGDGQFFGIYIYCNET